jgi:hypothetical protein
MTITIPAKQTLKAVRTFCVKQFSCRFDKDSIIEHFGLDLSQQLLNKRLIKKADDGYRLTRLGQRLIGKKLIRRLTPSEAKQRIAHVIARARKINANPDLLYGVRAIVLFGSCLQMAETVGDIDLAVDIRQKKHWTEEAHYARGESQGFRRGNYFAEPEIRRLLKARDPYISIVSDFIVRVQDFNPRMEIYRHNAKAFRFPTRAFICCSFCGKSQNHVAKLIIRGPRHEPKAAICNECVDSCVAITTEANRKNGGKDGDAIGA